jgi:hypothetical protein
MSELGERLRDLEIPDASGARSATTEKAAELAILATPRRGRLRRMRPAFIAAAAVAAVGGFALTPPGQAVTDEIGELVGIAEVGGPPTESSQVGNFDPASGQIVLATGATSDDVPFEIVAYRSDRSISGRQDSTICVNVEFPTVNAQQVESCYAGALRYGGVCCSSLVHRDDASTVPRVVGEVRPGVERVQATYVASDGTERSVEATIGMITPEFAERLAVEHPSGKFIASLPDLAEQPDLPEPLQGPASPVTIEVFDSSGDLIETETINPVSENRIRQQEEAIEFRETVDERRRAMERFHDQCNDRYDREPGPQTEIYVDELKGHCLELFEATVPRQSR